MATAVARWNQHWGSTGSLPLSRRSGNLGGIEAPIGDKSPTHSPTSDGDGNVGLWGVESSGVFEAIVVASARHPVESTHGVQAGQCWNRGG